MDVFWYLACIPMGQPVRDKWGKESSTLSLWNQKLICWCSNFRPMMTTNLQHANQQSLTWTGPISEVPDCCSLCSGVQQTARIVNSNAPIDRQLHAHRLPIDWQQSIGFRSIGDCMNSNNTTPLRWRWSTWQLRCTNPLPDELTTPRTLCRQRLLDRTGQHRWAQHTYSQSGRSAYPNFTK